MEKVEKTKETNSKKGGDKYVWVIIALSFLMVFTVLGFCSSSKGVYLNAITSSLNIDRTLFAINDSIRYVTTAVVNIFFGYLIMRFGVKKLVVAGFVALIGSMICYAVAENIYVFYVGGFLLGVGLSWTTTTMVGYVVNRWCKKNRGTIMGFILASNGIGGAVAISLLGPFIEMPNFGYRTAYWIIVGILAAVGILCAIFYKEKPVESEEDRKVEKKKGRGRSWSGIELSKASKKTYFYLACVCIFLTGFVLQGITNVANAHIKDVTGDDTLANTITSISLIILACSKFLVGFVYDKKGLRLTSTICSCAAVVVTFVLTFIGKTPYPAVFGILYAIMSSVALPLETIMLPIYAGDLFGEKSYSKILGIFVSVNTAGYALGAPAINLCHTLTGSYDIGFIISAVVMIAVIVTLQFVISAAQKERRAVEGEIVENVA